MKLLCTASKVPWFTVGREYDVDPAGFITADDHDCWIVEPHNSGYRIEHLEDAEFSVVPEYAPVAEADDGPYSAEELREEHEALLAAVVQMAEEEGCADLVRYNLAFFHSYWKAAEKNPKQQRAFLLALAYFAEEKSQ